MSIRKPVEIDALLAPFLSDERLRTYLDSGRWTIWYRQALGVTLQEIGRWGFPVHITTPDEALEWIIDCNTRLPNGVFKIEDEVYENAQ